jgi:cytoskeleton protein RodZ
LLRSARQAQGLHIAALATMLKVTPRKLEALEADRHEELQGITFVRALAQAACRALKIDPAPVLARLPGSQGNTLDQVDGGLNAPFREHGARRAATDAPRIGLGIVATVMVLLLGALAMYLVPSGWSMPVPWRATAAMPAVAASASASASAPNVVTQPPEASAGVPVTGAMPLTATEEPARLLQVRANGETWVDVIDANGQSLLSRTLQPGETVDLDGVLPLRVKIGNAAVTELSLRGQVLDLTPSIRDNVARLELK